MSKIRKDTALLFYDLIDYGLHPFKAYTEVSKLIRMDLLEALALAGIAERLAEDKTYYGVYNEGH